MSRPARARGLKLRMLRRHRPRNHVAPRKGAWIETLTLSTPLPSVWSRPARARGLKHERHEVADAGVESRPARARGLKLRRRMSLRTATVAPRKGAWIE